MHAVSSVVGEIPGLGRRPLPGSAGPEARPPSPGWPRLPSPSWESGVPEFAMTVVDRGHGVSYFFRTLRLVGRWSKIGEDGRQCGA